jgi:uncharacterized protein YbjT (DUF2867 family)
VARYDDICILGGTGFIGRRLAARLAADGRHVRILTRSRQRAGDLSVLPTVELVEVDVHDEDALVKAMRGSNAAINLVGILNQGGPNGFRAAHVELPRKVAQACRANGIRRLLHMSALKADAGNGASLYLRSKGEGEAALRVHSGKEVAFTIFQPSVVFGRGDGFINRFATLLRMTPLVFPLARAPSRFQPVHVSDVAEAFTRALDDPATHGQRYALCGPRVYSLKEIVCMVRDHLGLRRWVVGIPDALGLAQGAVLQYLPGTPFSVDNFRSLQVDSVCDGDTQGLGALGIRATPLDLEMDRILERQHHPRQ